MRTRLCVLAVAAIVAWGLKRHYADASVDELACILRPTARLVAVLTGSTFVVVPGEGFVSYERLFVIEKACAGVNFMIAAFALVVLARLQRARTAMSGGTLLATALVTSYGTAVLVNAARITIAIWLAAHPALPVAGAQLHRIEGVVVYFSALWALYEVVQHFERRDSPVKPVIC